MVIVGAGPAGLSAAIRLKQLANEAQRELSVCVLEKGSEVGAHILSGAVIDPDRAQRADSRLEGQGLAADRAGHRKPSLGAGEERQVRDAARAAAAVHEQQGHIHAEPGQFLPLAGGSGGGAGGRNFPGFPASEILFDDEGSVKGVATGDIGIARDGSHRADYQPGMELHARYTFFAEGARGHLTKRLTEIFGLRDESGPQIFGLGSRNCGRFLPTNISQGE